MKSIRRPRAATAIHPGLHRELPSSLWPWRRPLSSAPSFRPSSGRVAAGIISQVPLARFGNADEVAKAVLFLASDDSTFILGEEIIVDGGMATL